MGPDKLVQFLALLMYIRKVPCSSLGWASTSNRRQPTTVHSKSLPVYHSAVMLPLHSVSVLKRATINCGADCYSLCVNTIRLSCGVEKLWSWHPSVEKDRVLLWVWEERAARWVTRVSHNKRRIGEGKQGAITAPRCVGMQSVKPLQTMLQCCLWWGRCFWSRKGGNKGEEES